MKSVIFVSGTGSQVGKSIVSAILAEALEADYWKPIHAGTSNEPDSEKVKKLISNSKSVVHSEVYSFKNGEIPYYAAKQEGSKISLEKIFAAYCLLSSANDTLIVEGPGGLITPLTETEFVADLIRVLNGRVVLVTKNYTDCINHALLTSKISRQKNLRVLGWLFNQKLQQYENEITRWSGFPSIGSVPDFQTMNKELIAETAATLRSNILQVLPSPHAEGRRSFIIP